MLRGKGERSFSVVVFPNRREKKVVLGINFGGRTKEGSLQMVSLFSRIREAWISAAGSWRSKNFQAVW